MPMVRPKLIRLLPAVLLCAPPAGQIHAESPAVAGQQTVQPPPAPQQPAQAPAQAASGPTDMEEPPLKDFLVLQGPYGDLNKNREQLYKLLGYNGTIEKEDENGEVVWEDDWVKASDVKNNFQNLLKSPLFKNKPATLIQDAGKPFVKIELGPGRAAIFDPRTGKLVLVERKTGPQGTKDVVRQGKIQNGALVESEPAPEVELVAPADGPAGGAPPAAGGTGNFPQGAHGSTVDKILSAPANARPFESFAHIFDGAAPRNSRKEDARFDRAGDNRVLAAAVGPAGLAAAGNSAGPAAHFSVSDPIPASGIDPNLARRLRVDAPEVRSKAAGELAALGPKGIPAIASLILDDRNDGMNKTDYRTWLAVRQAFKTIGRDGKDQFLELAATGNRLQRALALHALDESGALKGMAPGEIRRAVSGAAAVLAMPSRRRFQRQGYLWALEVLRKSGPAARPALPQLLELVAADEVLSDRAADIAAAADPKGSAALLTKMLLGDLKAAASSPGRLRVLRFAARLAFEGHAPSAAALEAIIQDSAGDRGQWRAASWALIGLSSKKHRGEAFGKLLELAKSSDDRVKADAIIGLAYLAPLNAENEVSRAVGKLIVAPMRREKADPELKKAVARAGAILAQRSSPDGFQALRFALISADYVQANAAVSLLARSSERGERWASKALADSVLQIQDAGNRHAALVRLERDASNLSKKAVDMLLRQLGHASRDRTKTGYLISSEKRVWRLLAGREKSAHPIHALLPFVHDADPKFRARMRGTAKKFLTGDAAGGYATLGDSAKDYALGPDSRSKALQLLAGYALVDPAAGSALAKAARRLDVWSAAPVGAGEKRMQAADRAMVTRAVDRLAAAGARGVPGLSSVLSVRPKQAGAALWRLGPAGWKALSGFVADSGIDLGRRLAALEGAGVDYLYKSGPDKSKVLLPVLKQGLDSPQAGHQRAAAALLARIGGDGAAKLLKEALASRFQEVRLEAALGLARDPKHAAAAVPELKRIAAGGMSDQRVSAILALSKLAPHAGILGYLRGAHFDDAQWVRLADGADGDVRKEAVSRLIRRLQHGRSAAEMEATLKALKSMRSPDQRLVDALEYLLRFRKSHPDLAVSSYGRLRSDRKLGESAIEALGLFAERDEKLDVSRSARGLSGLVGGLYGNGPLKAVRLRSIEALGRFGKRAEKYLAAIDAVAQGRSEDASALQSAQTAQVRIFRSMLQVGTRGGGTEALVASLKARAGAWTPRAFLKYRDYWENPFRGNTFSGLPDLNPGVYLPAVEALAQKGPDAKGALPLLYNARDALQVLARTRTGLVKDSKTVDVMLARTLLAIGKIDSAALEKQARDGLHTALPPSKSAPPGPGKALGAAWNALLGGPSSARSWRAQKRERLRVQEEAGALAWFRAQSYRDAQGDLHHGFAMQWSDGRWQFDGDDGYYAALRPDGTAEAGSHASGARVATGDEIRLLHDPRTGKFERGERTGGGKFAVSVGWSRTGSVFSGVFHGKKFETEPGQVVRYQSKQDSARGKEKVLIGSIGRDGAFKLASWLELDGRGKPSEFILLAGGLGVVRDGRDVLFSAKGLAKVNAGEADLSGIPGSVLPDAQKRAFERYIRMTNSAVFLGSDRGMDGGSAFESGRLFWDSTNGEWKLELSLRTWRFFKNTFDSQSRFFTPKGDDADEIVVVNGRFRSGRRFGRGLSSWERLVAHNGEAARGRFKLIPVSQQVEIKKKWYEKPPEVIVSRGSFFADLELAAGRLKDATLIYGRGVGGALRPVSNLVLGGAYAYKGEFEYLMGDVGSAQESRLAVLHAWGGLNPIANFERMGREAAGLPVDDKRMLRAYQFLKRYSSHSAGKQLDARLDAIWKGNRLGEKQFGDLWFYEKGKLTGRDRRLAAADKAVSLENKAMWFMEKAADKRAGGDVAGARAEEGKALIWTAGEGLASGFGMAKILGKAGVLMGLMPLAEAADAYSEYRLYAKRGDGDLADMHAGRARLALYDFGGTAWGLRHGLRRPATPARALRRQGARLKRLGLAPGDFDGLSRAEAAHKINEAGLRSIAQRGGFEEGAPSKETRAAIGDIDALLGALWNVRPAGPARWGDWVNGLFRGKRDGGAADKTANGSPDVKGTNGGTQRGVAGSGWDLFWQRLVRAAAEQDVHGRSSRHSAPSDPSKLGSYALRPAETKTVKRYGITDYEGIGGGSFGRVWEGRIPKAGAKLEGHAFKPGDAVAVKQAGAAGADGIDPTKMLAHEWAMLKVVAGNDLFVRAAYDPELGVLVMENLKAKGFRPLDAWSAGRSVSAAEYARIQSQLNEALVALKEAGIVHGDLKPDNIMVGPDLRIKVVDFGIASKAGGYPEIGRDKARLGNRAYVSRNQAENGPAAHADDAHTAGVVLANLKRLASAKVKSSGSAQHAAPTRGPPDAKAPGGDGRSRFLDGKSVQDEFFGGRDPLQLKGVPLGGISAGAKLVTAPDGSRWAVKVWRVFNNDAEGRAESRVKIRNEIFFRELIRRHFPEFKAPQAFAYQAGNDYVVVSRYADGAHHHAEKFLNMDARQRRALTELSLIFGLGDVNYGNVLFRSGGRRPVLIDFEFGGESYKASPEGAYGAVVNGWAPFVDRADPSANAGLADGLPYWRKNWDGLQSDLRARLRRAGFGDSEVEKFLRQSKRNLDAFEKNLAVYRSAAEKFAGRRTPGEPESRKGSPRLGSGSEAAGRAFASPDLPADASRSVVLLSGEMRYRLPGEAGSLRIARAADGSYTVQVGEKGVVKTAKPGDALTLGRAADSVLRVGDGAVSRNHLKIVFSKDGFAITRLGKYRTSSDFEIGDAVGPNGHYFHGGVSRGRSVAREELVIDWARDKSLSKLFDDATSGKTPASAAKGEEALIRSVHDVVRRRIKFDEAHEAQLVREHERRSILLGDAAIACGKGVCRHQALAAGAVAERMILEGYLKGRIFYVRGRGHAWAVYRTTEGKLWVLDPAQAEAPVPMDSKNAVYASGLHLRKYADDFPAGLRNIKWGRGAEDSGRSK